MAESFLAVLVSSVENYKVLLQQSKHFKKVSRARGELSFQGPPPLPHCVML